MTTLSFPFATAPRYLTDAGDEVFDLDTGVGAVRVNPADNIDPIFEVTSGYDDPNGFYLLVMPYAPPGQNPRPMDLWQVSVSGDGGTGLPVGCLTMQEGPGVRVYPVTLDLVEGVASVVTSGSPFPCRVFVRAFRFNTHTVVD